MFKAHNKYFHKYVQILPSEQYQWCHSGVFIVNFEQIP